MNRDCTLFIVHIPKAAGTTFRWILDRQYPDWRVFKVGNRIPEERQRLEAMSDADKRNLLGVFGHMCYGWHTTMPPDRAVAYVTILREPVARVVSLYHYIHLPDHYLGKVVKGMSLYHVATSGVTCTVDNGMVRQLCGDDQFLRKPYEDMIIPFGGVTREHLEKAKENLRHFDVVGTAEDFDSVLEQMRVVFGWRLLPFTNENITRWQQPSQKITQKGLDAVRDVNLLDIELFQWVKGGMRN